MNDDVAWVELDVRVGAGVSSMFRSRNGSKNM